MKRTLMLIFILLLTASCGGRRNNDFYRVNSMLAEMKSYTATAELTVYGNKGESKYRINQYWLAPNKLRLETIEPTFLKGKTLAYNGKSWQIYHPLINERYEVQNLESNDQMVYLGVLQASMLSGEDTEYKYVTREGTEYIEVKATLQGGNEYRSKVALYIGKKDNYPEFLEIYDNKGNIRVRVRYIDFVYNGELKDSLFRLD